MIILHSSMKYSYSKVNDMLKNIWNIGVYIKCPHKIDMHLLV